jgi:sugar phosphate isomerase/epimerase
MAGPCKGQGLLPACGHVPDMNTTRRDFLQRAAAGLGALTLSSLSSPAAESPPQTQAIKSSMRLGLVTYELAKDWTLETILKNCEATRFEGVELRTGHAHGVEVGLSKEQRGQVKQQFADSKVALMGLGSAFDYHTPDPAKLKHDIEATKAYILLAHDLGTSGVKVRPNGLPKEVPKEKTLEQIGRSLRELGQFGAEYGVQLRLEVHGPETSLVPNIKTILEVADHANVGACWNCNDSDLAGDGFDHNFDLLKNKIFSVHMRDLFLENYPFRRLLQRLNQIPFTGFCLAEIPVSADPVRLMRYYRALWLAYQDRL